MINTKLISSKWLSNLLFLLKHISTKYKTNIKQLNLKYPLEELIHTEEFTYRNAI